MFEATFEQGALLKAVVEAVKDLVQEANVECTAEGMNLQAMDSSHVSLVTLRLAADGFQKYRCDRNTSLGLSMANLSKILKTCQSDDKVTISAEDGCDTVTFRFQSAKGERSNVITLKLMDIEADALGIPDQEYKSTIVLDSKEFQRIIRDIAIIGDSVTLKVQPDSVTFSAHGDIGTSEITLKPQAPAADDKEDKGPNVKIEAAKEQLQLNFAMRYMSIFTKATGLSESVKLQLSGDHPLVVEYPIESFGFLRFYLAPKIDEDNAETADE